MGLDIYLSTKARAELMDAYEAAWNPFYERPDYDQLTDEQKAEIKAGFPEWPKHDDVPSRAYPDHLFNRRYLRSSYNGGGFNHAVPDFLGTAGEVDYPYARGSLYWIFEPMGREWDGDEGRLIADDLPKLEECKARALQIADELRKCDPLRVESIGGPLLGHREHQWRSLPTQDEVLAWYRDEKARHSDRPLVGGDSYSNAKGHVFGFDSGLEVLAVTLGQHLFGMPAAMIVYRSKAIDSYIESAEITAEFCDEAMDLVRADGSCHIMWSG